MSSSPSWTHTQGCQSTAHCFCLRVTTGQCYTLGQAQLYPQSQTLWPTGSWSHVFLCTPCCLGCLPPWASEPLKHSYLPQLHHSEHMTRKTFSKDLQCSFILHMKVKFSENYSQNAIIDPNGLLRIHSPFSRIYFWPCQIRRLVSCPGGFSLKSQLPWHLLCFPGWHKLLTLMMGGFKYVHTATACCFICPTTALSKMLSEMVTAWLTCLLLSCLCSLCSGIPCTTELDMPSSGHFSSLVLIPGCPLLLGTYASLCHLCRFFCPDISIWPTSHSSCSCSATSGALGAICNKKGSTPLLPLPPPAVSSHVLILSSIANFKL